MARRESLSKWARKHIRVTDGPDRGKPIRLERWQKGVLDCIDREPRTVIALQMAAQCGKTTLAMIAALRSAVAGSGTIWGTATETGARDAGRRVDQVLEGNPELAAAFPSPRSGPGARASWKDRRLDGGGWLAFAAAGSASQLSSRTAQVAVCDELSRWPGRTRSGEGSGFQLLRARTLDYGQDARIIAISSPVVPTDQICLQFKDGDRRIPVYRCPACDGETIYEWSLVVGREANETPAIACQQCGVLHAERSRRAMLRTMRWVAQRTDPIDPDCASFRLSRLDSARSSLHQVCAEFRRARLAAERGDPRAVAAFRNLHLGEPAETGADIDVVYERQRYRTIRADIEQICVGADVQLDRIYWCSAAFTAGNQDIWIADYGCVLGDPSEGEIWNVLETTINRPMHAGMRPTVVSIDCGFLTSHVRRACAQRRGWLPVKGLSGEGVPIARRIGASGIAVVGRDDANSTWTARVAANRAHFPERITRPELADMAGGEALTAEAGGLRWRPVAGRSNHLFDSAVYALHARTFAPRTGGRRRIRLVAV